MSNYKVDLHKIKAFVFDVDGVFTDGKVLMYKDGDLLRSYDAKDGYAVRYAVTKGYPVGIITGGSSETICLRFRQLDVTDIYLSSRYKLPDFEDFCYKYDLQPDEVLFMGDDIPDICIMEQCGLPACPADAVAEVKQVATYISGQGGGQGCVRDVIEQVLKVQGNWHNDEQVTST